MTLNVNAIRKDFPCLEQKFKGKPPIYFDNACMTLRPRQVVEAISAYYLNHPSCHKRAVHKFGEQTTAAFDAARKAVARFINARHANEVVFTRNTTEGINLIAHAFPLHAGDRVITTDMEHNSNLLPWQVLGRTREIEHVCVPLLPDFSFDFDAYRQQLERGAKLVSIFHVSHVTGSALPVSEIITMAHEYGARVLIDCAQSASRETIDVQTLDADFLAFSFHKMMGPSGMGALYIRSDLFPMLGTFMVGGETVDDVDYHSCVFFDGAPRFEAGLQDYAGAMGAHAAVQYLETLGVGNVHRHETALNALITEELKDTPRLKLLGPQAPDARGGIVNFVIDGVDSGELSILLDRSANIMTRSGVHCCHAWYKKSDLPPSLRASLCAYNTEEECRLFAKTIRDVARYF